MWYKTMAACVLKKKKHMYIAIPKVKKDFKTIYTPIKPSKYEKLGKDKRKKTN